MFSVCASVCPVCFKKLKTRKIKDEWLSSFLERASIIETLNFHRMFAHFLDLSRTIGKECYQRENGKLGWGRFTF